ncbi:FAD-dependent thymidylate synthase [Bacteroides sp.]|uniref:FAD-dependent thymidylate synthase n=1 Tax=Bacteroides sp. TaxID=29523 RepID=UPI002628663C|nr:FAD-dependent thymidylate synthase [Bacteroides sp.]MDD3041291.1 thymidylate synthase ThyX [Bacteroides sp.]
MKTKILKVKGDWLEVLNDCRATVGKDARDKDPSTEFKKKILIAEHSPIRDIIIKWAWKDIKSWISVHFVRGKYEKFVRTQRDDRTGVPRDDLPQGSLVDMTMELNVQHLIDTSRKRLCRQSHPETRAYMEDIKKKIHEVEPEIADVMVPNCIYRGCACPEIQKCGFIDSFIKKHGIIAPIQDRYDTYNQDFYGEDN